MSFLSLSPELIEQIASYLRPKDLAALMLSCRRCRDVVGGSLLLQYIYRTGLAGVYDPLYDLSTCPIPERLETLRRWEASWAHLERCLAVPQLVISMDQGVYGQTFLCNDYLFVLGWQYGIGPFASTLLYVDLRDALHKGQYLWKQINHPPNSVTVWVFHAYSIEQNDLVVSVLSIPGINRDGAQSKIMLQFTSLETGGAHPLARLPEIQVDTVRSIISSKIEIDILGDKIVLTLADLYIGDQDKMRNLIYLVDWRQGYILLVHCAPGAEYASAFSVLSSNVLLFLKLDKSPPSIELCRLTSPDPSPSPRGEGSSSDDGTLTPIPASTPTLRVVRTLALPEFNPAWNLISANVRTGRHIERRRKPSMTLREQEQEEGCMRPVRAPAPLPFNSAPEDRVVDITFNLNSGTSSEKVLMVVSHRALFALAADGHPTDNCRLGTDGSAGGNGGESEGKGAEERKQGQVMVPWEEWGPQASHVIEPSSSQWNTIYAGQRSFSLGSDKLMIRDFSATRVRCAHTRSHCTHVFSNTCKDEQQEEMAAGAITETLIQGGSGSCFKHDVISSLPFLETHVNMCKGPRDYILTDGERLIVFACGDGMDLPLTFDVHVLEDNESPTSAKTPLASPGPEPSCSSTPVSSPMGSYTPRSRSRTCEHTAVLANGCASCQIA